MATRTTGRHTTVATYSDSKLQREVSGWKPVVNQGMHKENHAPATANKQARGKPSAGSAKKGGDKCCACLDLQAELDRCQQALSASEAEDHEMSSRMAKMQARLELLETLAAQEVCSRGAQTDEALLSDAWLPAARRKGVPRRLPAGLVPLVKTEAGTDEEAAGAAGVPHSGCKRRRQASDAVHQAPPAAAAAGSAAAAARIELCAVDAGGALSAAPAGAAPAPKPAAPPGATVPAASQVIEELAGAGASCRSPGRQPRAAADAAAPACTASTSREEQPDATVSQQRQQKETGEGGLDGGCCTVRADAAAPQATSDGVPAQGRDAVEELPSAETKASSPAAAGAAPAAEPVAELESLGLPGAAVQATAAGTSAGGSPTVGGDGCTVEQRGDLLLSPLPGIRLEGQAASPCRIN